MPNTTGIELLEEIRKISPDSTRILLTAYNSIHVAVNAIKRGRIYRFMTKPWSDYELKVNIRESITRYELIKGIRNLKKINLEKIADPTNFIDVSHRINPQALDGINTFFIGVDHKGDILFQNQNSKITFLEYPELSSIKNISKFFPENIMKIISDSFYAKDYLVIPEFKYDRNVFWGISSSVVCQNSKKISIIILVKKIRI
jgi:YesN/AraC family two-component response regulator